MQTPITKVLFLISLNVLFVSMVRAQGVIVPGPCERCISQPPPLPLPHSLPVKSIKIDTKIAAQVATTHVEQVFRNDTDVVLEGTYLFPIPEAASIIEFAIWDGDRRLVGEVRSREEARRIYDEIVRRQRDPGLLEYAGKDLFQASIFPIPPRSDKKLEITYSQVLRAESGTVAYRYPLGIGRQLTQIGTVAGRIELEGKDPLRNIYSPTHEIDIKRNGEHRSVVSFETQSGMEPRDFQLFYTLSRENFGLTLLTHREAGKDGYFLLMIAPKADWSDQEFVARDIVFVLDTSGSMADEGKMEKARAALLYGIKTLRSEDRFNVISFAGEEHAMETGLLAADDQGRKRGEAFVQALRPVGGTNINQALLAAEHQFENSKRTKILVFLTDGLPTVGETNISYIVDNIRGSRMAGVRLFTFGVGYDVNTTLLDKLAAENGGVADYVEPKEDLEIKVSNFFSKISYPVLTDLTLEMGGVETDLVYPKGIPDLFRGSQVMLIGRYRNPINMEYVRLQLTGKSNGQVRSFFYDNLHFPLREETNDFLPRLWATRRVGWLMEQIRSNGEQKELRDEVIDLGTRYGIVTAYTSYLALESSGQVRDITSQRMQRAPQPDFAGGNIPPASRAGSVNTATGISAVRQSKAARVMQEADQVSVTASSSAVRNVAGKTFYLRDGVWTDSEFKPDAGLPETALKFASDEYFAFLKSKPRLAKFFALGEKVIVVFEGRVYRVSSATL